MTKAFYLYIKTVYAHYLTIYLYLTSLCVTVCSVKIYFWNLSMQRIISYFLGKVMDLKQIVQGLSLIHI